MEKAGFWFRVGHWFKPSGRGRESRRTAAAEPFGDGSVDELGSAGPADFGLAREGTTSVAKLRRTRPGTYLERLEEEYARVVQLMGTIQEHLASQAERSDRMAQSLESLAESLAHTPEMAKRQLELLGSIGEQVAADAARAQRVEENLSQLPQIADAQRETMVSVGRQLDSARESSERVANTMKSVQEAVSGLGETTTASTKTLQEMRWDASARDERIANLLQEQGKRFSVFAWSVMGLALVLAVVGLIALLQQ